MKTYDYFNTWQTQCVLGYTKNISCRDIFNEDFLFNKKNGLVNLYKEIRSNLIFVLDDGWDVTYDNNIFEKYRFASHIIRTDKFKSIQGNPAERLKMIVDKIKSYGWKGVGIWVCCQGYDKDEPLDLNSTINTFKKKLEWSKYANIIYWKVDWGKFDKDSLFRKKLNDLKNKIYPELIIEDAFCMPPVNGICENVDDDKKLMYPYSDFMKTTIDKTLKFTEVFRSYDVNEEQSTVTTLQRVAYLLKQKNALINVEDELYLGAILGCPVGIQRSALLKDIIKEDYRGHKKTNEAIATINYKKIAPSFTGYKLNVSKEVFEVPYFYNNHWKQELNKHEIIQIAPQIISRNSKLVQVKAIKEIPFIVSCLNPNNNYALGSFTRLNLDDNSRYLVDVNAFLDILPSSVAIFNNHINKISIKFKEKYNNKKFILVNLINKKEKEINNGVKLKDNKLMINYSYLTKPFKCKDNSNKAYLIKIVEK